MRIGIIGTGNMGRALGRGWANAGHDVCYGSRSISKSKAVASDTGGSAIGGTLDEAAMFGDIVLHTVRDVLPSQLLTDATRTLSGKILIDCNNGPILGLEAPDPLGRAGVHFNASSSSLAERLATDVPGARVVKTFNTIPSGVIELGRDKLAPHRVSVFVCGDDGEARSVVQGLAGDLGFVGVDSGKLERAQMVEVVADFIRFQIVEMGLGPFATISINVLSA